MRIDILKYILLFASVFIGFTYCTEETTSCPDTDVPYLRLSFVNSGISLDTAIIYNELLGDYFYNSDTAPGTVEIPLNLNSDTTYIDFEFMYADSAVVFRDRIYFVYEHSIQTEDIECGFYTTFELNEILATTNSIDSIYFLDSVINSYENIHAEIYY